MTIDHHLTPAQGEALREEFYSKARAASAAGQRREAELWTEAAEMVTAARRQAFDGRAAEDARRRQARRIQSEKLQKLCKAHGLHTASA